MKLSSVFAALAAFGLTAVLAAAAHAALIVTAIPGGPFSPANPLGTIPSTDLFQGNTYDFTFGISGTGSVLTEVEAAIAGPVSEPIDFSLYSGDPGSGTLIGTSTLMDGPSMTETLGVGSYFLQVDTIEANGELFDGGLQVASVPEPATWALALVGMASLGGAMRLRRVARG
ncbi:MAG TPA: PEPxxWA-CTERM sorting domain-containing protein [Caulobacteraceae bacterium]|jgi:hypothetical protein